jgi:hypothetical protein
MIRAIRQILAIWFLGVLPLVFAIWMLKLEAHDGLLGFDFRGTLWEPGRHILAGESPYPPPLASAIDHGNPSVYPPVALWLAVPFALLPFTVAYWLWTALLTASVIATLYVLGVRNWRFYTLGLSSCPMFFGVVFGNVVLLLVPLAALVWRRRDEPRWAGIALGAAIAIKLVLWPLLFWLIAAKRGAAAAVAAATAAVATLVAWAGLGFSGLTDYPRLVATNTRVYGEHSWALFAGAMGAGLPRGLASAVAWAFGLALLAVAVAVTRRPGGERHGFSIALVASVALVPVLWVYSLVVLLVPLAISARTRALPWYLFVGLWAAAFIPRATAHVGAPPDGVPAIVWRLNHSPAPTGQIAAFVTIVALVALATAWTDARPPRVTVA